MIEIKEVNIEEVLKVHRNIPEFYELIPKKGYFENRYKACVVFSGLYIFCKFI